MAAKSTLVHIFGQLSTMFIHKCMLAYWYSIIHRDQQSQTKGQKPVPDPIPIAGQVETL